MKTAISVPDGTYERVTKQAAELGMSRSEFFSKAADRYLRDLDAKSLTTQVDAVVDATGIESSNAAAAAVGRRRLSRQTDDW